MPQSIRPLRLICRDCDGFGRAVIATGLRRLDGSRDTIPVNCQTCNGLGTVARVPATAKAA